MPVGVVGSIVIVAVFALICWIYLRLCDRS
jgi:hypothetical protein